jgi:branched-chain amino acid aminotransferase
MSGPTGERLIVWLDGRLGDDTSLSIPVTDRGLLVGDGVFETLPIIAGVNGNVNEARTFALSRHLDRLTDGCRTAGIAIPADGVVRAAVEAVLDAYGNTTGRLRITATGSGHLLITAASAPSPLASVSVLTSPWVRNVRSPITGVKSTSYAENAYALRWAQSLGADEAVMANTRGELCESTTANVFVVLHGELVTPPLSSGCLPGVTRDILLAHGIGVERDLPIGVLVEVEEAFLTNSLRGVLPVHSIDGRALGSVSGPNTRRAADVYAELVATGSEP